MTKPTGGELEILRALWRRGPSTVRQVHEEIGRGQGYTTVLKLMQIMTEKGLIARTGAASPSDSRAHLYEASFSEEDVQSSLVDDLMERAFGGSAAKLALRALSRKRATRQEITEIRRMLDEYERKRS